MISGANNFNYFPENQLTKLVQFKQKDKSGQKRLPSQIGAAEQNQSHSCL